MLFNILQSGDIKSALIQMLLVIPVLLLSFSVHESAHGLVAYWLGDPTARNLGRLTLNPFKHLDLFGTLSMLLVGVGWAKPVPIHARYFKKPKLGMALSALAGPVSNFLLAFLAVICQQLTFLVANHTLTAASQEDTAVVAFSVVLSFFYNMAWMNISLGIFNLIPVPPFDGSRIAFALLPDRFYWGVMRYERYIMIGMIVLFFGLNRLGFNFIGGITELVYGVLNLLTYWITLL